MIVVDRDHLTTDQGISPDLLMRLITRVLNSEEAPGGVVGFEGEGEQRVRMHVEKSLVRIST